MAKLPSIVIKMSVFLGGCRMRVCRFQENFSTSCGTGEVSCQPSISLPRVIGYLEKWLMSQLKFCQSKINFNQSWDIQCTGIDKMSSTALPQHSISNLINFNKWPALQSSFCPHLIRICISLNRSLGIWRLLLWVFSYLCLLNITYEQPLVGC